MSDHRETIANLQDRSLLVVDDNKPFRNRLARAMRWRGFEVDVVDTIAKGIAHVKESPPAFAIVELRLEDGSGLDVIKALIPAKPEARAIILTGYGNIATAVAAMKLGAVDYLAKPTEADVILNALLGANSENMPDPPQTPMSAARVRWEHIQRVYELCDRNMAKTARQLNLHRRSLYRILGKRAPR